METKSRRQRAAETRNGLLAAAASCFSAAGYDGTSVDEICAAAGVSKGAFYHHFESKQALFVALLQDWLAGLDRAMLAARQPTIPETLMQMTRMLPVAISSAQNQIGIWLEFWLHASRDKAIRRQALAPYRHYRERFAEMIREGVDEGTFRRVDPDAAAQAILSLAVGLFLQSILDPKGADWQKSAAESMQTLLTGLMGAPENALKAGGRR